MTNKKKTKDKKKNKATLSAANSNNAASSSNTKSTPREAASTPAVDPKDETLWQTFTGHPLVAVSPFILLPYAIYMFFYYIALKRPEVVAQATFGLFSLRPAVHLHDSRQVLIVGAIGSGTQQVSASLSQIMKLEVPHECSETESFFARDGTVSTFLGVRYAKPLENERMAQVVTDVCIERGGKGSANVIVPKSYQPSSCSAYERWSSCHSQECLTLLSSEWGCGLLEDGCRSHFVRVLHLVQHPLRSIRELMAKVCPGSAKTVHPAFRQLATFFIDFSENASCLEVVSWYVTNFNRAMMAARSKGHIDAMFQYEHSSLCDVVDLAGFLDPELVVYKPNLPKLSKKCRNDGGSAASGHDTDATKLLPSLTKISDELRKLPVFTWEDFREAGGSKLEKSLRNLCRDLGYDPDTSEAEEFSSTNQQSGETGASDGGEKSKGKSSGSEEL